MSLILANLTDFNWTRQAYIEFASKESSMKAKHLNESLFKGRQLTVEPKRKNIRGMSRGGGFRGGRGGRALFSQFMSLFGRGMGFRGFRGRGGYRGRGRGGAPPHGGEAGGAAGGANQRED